jgi:dihydroorotate dehydrogenase
MYKLTEGKVPIIGVGGVGSGRDAYDKLKAGASLVQVYSMMVYEGPGVVSRIRKELADIILENGYKSVEDVVGAEHEDFYWNLREETARRKMQEREIVEKQIVDL